MSVPVTMSVQGDLLVLSVEKEAGQFEYPVLVDPEVKDEYVRRVNGHTSNWHFISSPGAQYFKGGEYYGGIYIEAKYQHSAEEWGLLAYRTQGESYITELKTLEGEAEMFERAHVEAYMVILNSQEQEEAPKTMLATGSLTGKKVSAKGSSGNGADYTMVSTHAGETENSYVRVNKAAVTIAQEKGPEISVDTTHENVDGGKRNVFYGAGGWLGPNSNSGFELHAKEHGIGVSYFNIKAGLGETFFTEADSLIENYECTGGVQCPLEVNKGYGYESQMPNGEDTLEAYVKNAMGSEAHITTEKIKVDAEPPHEITLTGFPATTNSATASASC